MIVFVDRINLESLKIKCMAAYKKKKIPDFSFY